MRIAYRIISLIVCASFFCCAAIAQKSKAPHAKKSAHQKPAAKPAAADSLLTGPTILITPSDGQKAVGDVDFGVYMANLMHRIKKHWVIPKGSESKVIVITFKINKDGVYKWPKVLHSSGVAAADTAALDAIGNAAPFRMLPDGAPESIDVQLRFDEKFLNGTGTGSFRNF